MDMFQGLSRALSTGTGKPCLRLVLNGSGPSALALAGLAIGALMPGVRLRQTGMQVVEVLPHYYKGSWRQLTVAELNAQLRKAAPSFLKSVSRPQLGRVELLLSYDGSLGGHAELLRSHLQRLAFVRSVTMPNGSTVVLSVKRTVRTKVMERQIRQSMRFGL